MDWRSCSRNSGLMCASKLTVWPGPGAAGGGWSSVLAWAGGLAWAGVLGWGGGAGPGGGFGGRAGRAPVPAGQRATRFGAVRGLRRRDPGAPVQVGGEGGAELGVGGQAGLVGGQAGQRDPAGSLVLGETSSRGRRPRTVLGGAAEDLGEDGGRTLRVVRGQGGELGRQQVVGGHVLLIQQAGHPG